MRSSMARASSIRPPRTSSSTRCCKQAAVSRAQPRCFAECLTFAQQKQRKIASPAMSGDSCEQRVDANGNLR